jgi:hypothetical protein
MVGWLLEKEGGEDDDGGEEGHRDILASDVLLHGYIYGRPCD